MKKKTKVEVYKIVTITVEPSLKSLNLNYTVTGFVIFTTKCKF